MTSNEDKYKLLESDSVKNRVISCIKYLKKEFEIIQESKQRRKNTGSSIKDIFSGFKAGGRNDNNMAENREDIQELKEKFDKLDLPEETKTIVEKELKNLSRIHPSHHEYNNIEKYLETLLDLPWNAVDKENLNPANAQKVLDQDHYGLEKVKKRIVEFLAVRKLKENHKGTIL